MAPRIAFVVSHVIQHFVPQYASIAQSGTFDVHVVFGTNRGHKTAHSPSFGRSLNWGSLPIDSFAHQFLDDVSSEDPERQARRVGPALDRISPDIVVVYGYRRPITVAAHRWARDRGVATAYIADSELRHRYAALKGKLNRKPGRHLRDCDWVMTVGDANEDYYRALGVPDEKMIRMGFPIDRERYDLAHRDLAHRRAAFRKELGIRDEQFVVGMVGKLIGRKRQEDLLAAGAAVGADATDAVVLLAGTGDRESQLRRLSGAERVQFLGFVPPSDLPNVYAACDVYAHTSAMEPHSLAITEATAMGLPIVVSHRCGSWGATDDVRIGENGWVYRCGDVPGLVERLGSLAGNNRLTAEFGAASRRIAVAGQDRSHRTSWLALRNRLAARNGTAHS